MTTSSDDSMSEHPELREALTLCLISAWTETGVDPDADYCRSTADALLAGPVGKLQAELAEAKAELVQLREEKACQFVIRSDEGTAYCSLAERSDPERIRREAIGAAVLGHTIGRVGHVELQDGTMWWRPVDGFVAHLLAAGESAVTGEPETRIVVDETGFGGLVNQFNSTPDGDDWTGEPPPSMEDQARASAEQPHPEEPW